MVSKFIHTNNARCVWKWPKLKWYRSVNRDFCVKICIDSLMNACLLDMITQEEQRREPTMQELMQQVAKLQEQQHEVPYINCYSSCYVVIKVVHAHDSAANGRVSRRKQTTTWGTVTVTDHAVWWLRLFVLMILQRLRSDLQGEVIPSLIYLLLNLKHLILTIYYLSHWRLLV